MLRQSQQQILQEGGRESERGSHAERRFAWRSFCYPLAAIAQAWLSATSRKVPSTTPRGNAPPSTLETMIHVQQYRRGRLQQWTKQISWLWLIWIYLKWQFGNCNESHTYLNLNTKIFVQISGTCISLSASRLLRYEVVCGESVVLDVTNWSDAFETSGATHWTQCRILSSELYELQSALWYDISLSVTTKWMVISDNKISRSTEFHNTQNI